MMKDVVISILSRNFADEDEDSIDFVTEGLYSFDGEVACVTYLESEVTGMEGTRTSLMIFAENLQFRTRDSVSVLIQFAYTYKPGHIHPMYLNILSYCAA